MLPTTHEAIRALLKTDPSLTPTDRQRIVATLRNHGRAQIGEPVETTPRLLRRAEAARRLGISLRTIDLWTHQGLLAKIKLPGRQRAAGFRETDIAVLICGEWPNGRRQE